MPERIRAIVVDDEPSAREVVVTLLENHPRIVLAGEAQNGHEAVRLVREAKPDLMFLDVQMPEVDGFGVIGALGSDVPRGVVFVTAHDEHALRAFDVHALDYVLKPFGRPRFDAAVERALRRLDEIDALAVQQTIASVERDREAGLQPGDLTSTGARRIGVRIGARTAVIEIGDIDWVEASGDYACIHAAGRSYAVSQRMNTLESVLDDAEFVRTHRSVIVNISRINVLHRDADGGGSVVLRDGVTLRVARGRWDAVTRALKLETM